jgi:hypothetical protein
VQEKSQNSRNCPSYRSQLTLKISYVINVINYCGCINSRGGGGRAAHACADRGAKSAWLPCDCGLIPLFSLHAGASRSIDLHANGREKGIFSYERENEESGWATK